MKTAVKVIAGLIVLWIVVAVAIAFVPILTP